MRRRLSLLAACAAVSWSCGARAQDALPLHVQRVEERQGQRRGTELWLVLDGRSRAEFATWTRRHLGQDVRLLIEGELLVQGRLGAPIADGTIVLPSGAGQRRGAIQTVLAHDKGLVTAVAIPQRRDR